MRKDARENRDKLIRAAREVMSEQGVDVPLDAISKKAGTTRGTLYRNFADRTELFRAVLDSELRSVTDSITEADGCGLFEVMRKLIEVSDLFHAYAHAVHRQPASIDARKVEQTLTAVLTPPLVWAKRQGVVRPDLKESEVLLACRMVAFGWHFDGEADRGTAIDKRLLLIIRGLAADPEISPER